MAEYRRAVALARLVACCALGALVIAAPTAHAQKPKCKSASHGKKVGKCPTKPSKIVSGFYTGKDSFGELGFTVGTETSGPHAGQRYVRLEGGAPVGVTCSNGLQGTVIQNALAYVNGKGTSFKGSESSASSEFTISGSFTSPTTLKGTFESSQSPFGYTCSTGKQSFTAKWTP